jgi:hypothetical protein
MELAGSSHSFSTQHGDSDLLKAASIIYSIDSPPFKGLNGMVNLIYDMPGILLFIVICLACILIACIITVLTHFYIPLKARYEENVATACISAFIGIIYAMLVGFTVLYELNTFNKADDAEDTEAKAMYATFRLARLLPEPTSTQIRNLIIEYANTVINKEWPLLANGKHVNRDGVEIIEKINFDIRAFKITDVVNPAVISTLNALAINASNLFDDHQERVAKIHNSISPNIWFVLLLGSLLAIAINCMLGMEIRMHYICILFVSFMISAVLYLIITLDRPYRGDFSIQPTTFISTLEYIQPST